MLAQPSLTKDSCYSHPITLKRENTKLRYTNFVEVMAPIFSLEALKICYNTFSKSSSGWGFDLIWPQILNYPTDKIAVIDETSIKQTRPVGSGNFYKSLNVSPYKEMCMVAEEYNVELPYTFYEYELVSSDNI